MPNQVAGAVKDLVERLEGVRAGGTRALTPKEELVLRLNEQYPLDVGVLSAFFLNLVTLKAGQVHMHPSPAQIAEFGVENGLIGRAKGAVGCPSVIARQVLPYFVLLARHLHTVSHGRCDASCYHVHLQL